MTKLLLVEDDASVRSTLSTFLDLEGYDVKSASSTKEALDLLSGSAFPIIVSDVYIDSKTGLDVLNAARAQDPECSVILMSARGTMETVMAATRGGAFDYLAKPFELDRLLDIVKKAERSRQVTEKETEIDDMPDTEMIGSSAGMIEIYKTVSLVAPTDATVLIEGETGTGKELVARMIHRNSARASMPFVPRGLRRDCADVN